MPKFKTDEAIEIEEVKDILEQLQNLRISENSVIAPPQSAEQSPTTQQNKLNTRKLLFPLISTLVVCTSAAAGYAAFNYSIFVEGKKQEIVRKAPELQEVQPSVKDVIKQPEKQEKQLPQIPEAAKIPDAATKIISEADKLIKTGQTISARNKLIKGAQDYNTVAQIPFLLAQTYDPNFLKDLPSTDVDAELSEARKWYRVWYNVARQSSNPPTPDKLEQLLNKLQ